MRRIYLDHGATSFPKAPGVADAVASFLRNDAGNPGRGGHRLAVAASRAIEGARESIAELLGGNPERTLFGPGSTFWLNTLCSGLLGPGDTVVTSVLEHNSVMRPLRYLEAARGITIVTVRTANASGVPDPAEVRSTVSAARAKLVVMTHASNVTGAVFPLEDIAEAVAPVPVAADGAQTAGSVPFDFASSGLAAYACSGHKGLLGPTGTGVLLLAPLLADELQPLVRGGTGSRSESEEMPVPLPDRLEAGTPNGAGIAGLGVAARWLMARGVSSIHQHENRLVTALAGRLSSIPGVHVHGWDPGRPHTGILSFTVDGVDTGELAAWLDRERGIMLRAGLHCAPAAHRWLGTFPSGTLRPGLSPFSTDADIEALAAAVDEFAARRRST